MQKDHDMPWWVFLALSSIETRKAALLLVWSSLLFSLYCVPWSIYLHHPWVGQLFLLDDWEWFAMMLPMTVWYWLSLKWVDRNRDWQKAANQV